MGWLRTRRVRFRVSWLALFALVAQALILSQHAAGAAARGAGQSLVGADLAHLGLTLADIACHSGATDRSETDSRTGHHPSTHTPCPVCTLHATAGFALLPASVGDILASPRSRPVFGHASTVSDPASSGLRPPVRGPPVGV